MNKLGLIKHKKLDTNPASTGAVNKGPNQVPHGPAKGSVKASSARKKASSFSGNFKFC